MHPLPEPRRVAIRPFQCFWHGLRRLRGSYFAFAAVAAIVGIGAQVPLGLLYFPLLVGAHLCFLDQERTGRVRIDSVFGGFRDFVQSLIISLLALAVGSVLAAVLFAFFFLALLIAKGLGWTENAQMAYALSCGGIVLFLGIGACHAALGFAPHLRAERGLDGVDAVRVSFRAARLNFPGLFVLWWMHFLLTLLSSTCCLPFPFVYPVCMAAVVEAFRRVFGEPPAEVAAPGDPLAAA